MILKTVFVMFIVWDAPYPITMNQSWSGADSMEECLSVLYREVKKGHPFSDQPQYPVKDARCEAVRIWEGQPVLRYNDSLILSDDD